jgi:Uma2 family endonuclease
LRSLLGAWFSNHREEWNIKAGIGIRTRVSAERVRLPDVIVDYKRKGPATLAEPPLIVIDVLSPTDSYSETKTLARDYIDMGVRNIWLVDPERRACEMYRDGVWVDAMRLDVPGSPI